VEREILSYTVPYRMYCEMSANAPDSFFKTSPWKKLHERQESDY